MMHPLLLFRRKAPVFVKPRTYPGLHLFHYRFVLAFHQIEVSRRPRQVWSGPIRRT